MQSDAPTVRAYLASLPPERRAMVETLRAAVLANLPDGFEERMQYGMIGYCVPLERYPDTYNEHPLAIAGIASQKQYVSVYLTGVYLDPDARAWLERALGAAGKRVDVGKSCVRFRKPGDVAADVIGEAAGMFDVDAFLRMHEASRA